MKNDLQKDIAQLFAEKLSVLKVYSLDDFAGLFDEIASDGLVSLFSVPGAAALASEKSDDVEQIVY